MDSKPTILKFRLEKINNGLLVLEHSGLAEAIQKDSGWRVCPRHFAKDIGESADKISENISSHVSMSINELFKYNTDKELIATIQVIGQDEQPVTFENMLKALQYAKKTIDEFEKKFPEQAHEVMGVDEMIFIETILKKQPQTEE